MPSKVLQIRKYNCTCKNLFTIAMPCPITYTRHVLTIDGSTMPLCSLTGRSLLQVWPIVASACHCQCRYGDAKDPMTTSHPSGASCSPPTLARRWAAAAVVAANIDGNSIPPALHVPTLGKWLQTSATLTASCRQRRWDAE